MTRKIGEITGEMMLSGVYADLPQKQPPIFKNARNVIFSDNSVQPVPGQYVLTAGTAGQAIRGFLSVRIGGTPILFSGDDSKLYRYTISGGTTEVGTGFSGEGNIWSFTRWGTWVLATNNKNLPQIYKGSSFSALTGLSTVMTSVKKFLGYKNYVLAFSDEVGGRDARIAWCTADDPETWIAALTNSARTLDIRDTTSGITDAVIANERIYYFTLKSMSVQSFIGPPTFFSSNKITEDIGAFGPASTVEVGGQIYGIGPNGAWRTDGSGYNYIDEGRVHDRIFNDINLDYADRCVVWHDTFTKQIVYWIPGANATEVSYGLGYNYLYNSWAPRGDARSAALKSGDFSWGILGDTSGNIYAQSLVGAPISAQDPNLHVTGAGFVSSGFGESGFGQLGVGGTLELTE